MFWLTERTLPAAAASSRSFDRLLQRQRQRLLRQDALDVRLLQRVADQRRLLVGREGEVEDLDAGVLDQLLRRVVDASGCPSARPPWRRWRGCARRSPPPEAGLLVGGEMAFGHDHAGADAADAELARADLHVRLELPDRHLSSSRSPCGRAALPPAGRNNAPAPARRTAPPAPPAVCRAGRAAARAAAPAPASSVTTV